MTAIEKRKLDNMTDVNCPPDPTKNSALRDLAAELKEKYTNKRLDGYCLYLYGVILKKLDLNSLAIDVFVEAVNVEPLHWGAWQELAFLVPNKHKLNSLLLPDHWIKLFFLAHAYLEQLNNEEALQLYYNLHSQGFEKSTYIMAQMAIAYHNRRELDKAITTFKDLLALDPFRLDNLDTYSNLLYVKEMTTELADLAHKAVDIDKYRVETCCVIGNYYSLRSEHAKAVLYFQRALKLNPQYLSAWTLMGHEYMEMKNTNAAIQSYRQAIEVNRRDYRAWYGLGQTYEILKMPFYCIYYYKQAQQMRPNDSRMIIALGETYEKLEKFENALKCYYKACSVGDIEGMALIKLAKLYDKLNEHDNAAAAYTEYCLKEAEQQRTSYEDKNEYYMALQYLANYHLEKGQLEDASTCAYKCLEHDETKEQGKALLKAIAAKRGKQEMEPVPMDETGNISNISVDSSVSNMDMVFSPNT
ncbi:cell division cycle protein 23 homolog isoform X2 [Agrilus planipennis]|uniref:Cyclosome subunit 8 n=1 Tax=Agrilus planipennis TaxID=224129 RepID=A0A1W4WWL7_AGRPL|nr:cell division cycle protein 23 homolog isoform X2 [Agrilus planipennis]